VCGGHPASMSGHRRVCPLWTSGPGLEPPAARENMPDARQHCRLLHTPALRTSSFARYGFERVLKYNVVAVIMFSCFLRHI